MDWMRPDWLNWIPFVGLAVNGNKTNWHSPLVVRLIETVVIGGVILYGTVQVLGSEIDALQRDVNEIKQDVRDMRRDIYQPQIPSGLRYERNLASF